MPPNEHLLQNLCREAETLTEALNLLRIAQQKTAQVRASRLDRIPRPSRHLREYCLRKVSGAISKGLKNGDVNRTAAQIASCLKKSDFEKTFHIRNRTDVSYESLFKKYELPMAKELVPWMSQAERALIELDSRYSPVTTDLKCAVFFWVCSALKGKKYIFPLHTYSEENSISQKSLVTTFNQLTNNFADLKSQIIDAIKTRRASPSKPTAPPPPPKNRHTPQKRKVLFPQSQFDDAAMDMDPPETPTKKQKLPSESNPGLPPISGLPTAHMASSSRVMLETLHETQPSGSLPLRRVDTSAPSTPRRVRSPTKRRVAVVLEEESSPDEEATLPRRFRPIYLDQQQWGSCDPRVERIRKLGEKHKKGMIGLYGHPFHHSHHVPTPESWDRASSDEGVYVDEMRL
ncbi:hypothetical protein BD779DRAFT_1500669 [Infundibulicybe gibba]|nr:hypothetical protein BD779DRAFT_1500669 [Infundibulicybe gibba]